MADTPDTATPAAPASVAPAPVQVPVSPAPVIREPGVDYDPNRGQGGAFTINEAGVRVPV